MGMTADRPIATPGPNDGTTVEDYPSGYKALRVVPGIFQLLGSSVLARTASRTYVILLVLFVLARYNSPTMSGLVVLASQIPGLLASPIAGALLDRRGRLTLIRLDFFTASTAIALITILDAVHLLPVWALYVIVVMSSLTQPLSATGTRSLFPLIVPRPLWDRGERTGRIELCRLERLRPGDRGFRRCYRRRSLGLAGSGTALPRRRLRPGGRTRSRPDPT